MSFATTTNTLPVLGMGASMRGVSVGGAPVRLCRPPFAVSFRAGTFVVAGLLSLAAMAWQGAAIAQDQSVIIHQPGTNLDWGNFKAKDKPKKADADAEAFTSTRIRMKHDAKCDPSTGTFTPPTIQTELLPDESWVGAGKQTDSLLHHEQGHLDVTETVARKMRTKFDALKEKCNCKTDPKQFKKDLDAAYKAAEAVLDGLQAEHNSYDTDTNHGRDSAGQTAWDKKIKEGLGGDKAPPPKPPAAAPKCPPPSTATPPTGGGTSTVKPKPNHPADCTKCAGLREKIAQLKADKTSTEFQLGTQEQNVKDNETKNITGPAADNAKRQVSELKQALKDIDADLKQAEADANACGGVGYCPARTSTGVEVSLSVGTSTTSTSLTNVADFSNNVQDPNVQNSARGIGTGFVGGVGVSVALGEFNNPFSADAGGMATRLSYASEAESAYAAFPMALPARDSITYGVDGNVYFFAGGDGHVHGIPGGPFGTAVGADNFKVSNNYMFTAGAFMTAPIASAWRLSVTGGVAELNQTVKYNCVSFCAVAPATSAFTASQDKWVTGAYVGGRVSLPIVLPAFAGANVGIDYKHVFFDSYNVSLGSTATRQVNARLTPDMDIVTVRLGLPLN